MLVRIIFVWKNIFEHSLIIPNYFTKSKKLIGHFRRFSDIFELFPKGPYCCKSAELFELLEEKELESIVSELDLDDAADLLAELPDELSQKVLKNIEPAESAKIKKLMSYSEDSAGVEEQRIPRVCTPAQIQLTIYDLQFTIEN